VLGLGKLIVLAALLFGVGVASFAVSSNITLSFASSVVAGFGAVILVASSNTILQTILEEDKRGRVMSFFTVAFLGMAPFGSIGVGTMAGVIGPRETLLVGAVCSLGGALMFARHLPEIREAVRPIYVKMGILREVADGMETAAEQPPLPTKSDR
jgi:MFS family permease